MNYTSKKNHFFFRLADKSWKSQNDRKGETKLSSSIRFGDDSKSCKYLIIGISEDIGPQMNNGFPGSKNGFMSFVSSLQNVQSNQFLNGSEIGLLGEIHQNQDFTTIEASNGWVEELDDFLFDILQLHVSEYQIIIAIGGGHNNAYSLLKHAKHSGNKLTHAINIDPHADCRTTDFRHSGNPFSYAIKDFHLNSYSIIGLHESYNNEYTLDFLSNQSVKRSYFEDFLDNEISFWGKIDTYSEGLDKTWDYTLDLDLDSIAFAPSSALTPSGFSIEDCRKMVRKLSSIFKFRHFHLPEGAPETKEEIQNYAKMISYFVVDFIKCQNNLLK
jgi:formiminoglutamase